MIVCSILWYAVLKLTDSQWGILAIVVGLVVGGAVRKGSNARGRWRYQALAIFLTYTAIVSSYVPFVIESMREDAGQVAEQPADPAVGVTPPTVSGHAVATTDAAAPAAVQLGVLAVLVGLVALVAAGRAWGGKAPEEGDARALWAYSLLTVALGALTRIPVP